MCFTIFMITLILAILIGIGISLFSTQNTHPVTITLANYPLSGIPLYLIVIVSLLAGIVISFIMHTVSLLSSFFAIQQKDTTIKHAHATIANLKEKIRELELENERLKEISNEPRIVEKGEERPHTHWSFPFFTKFGKTI